MEQLLERIEIALGAMSSAGPRNLVAYLTQPGPDLPKSTGEDVNAMIDLLLSDNPNHPARLRFSSLLRAWDNAKDAKWANGTSRNTEQRRKQIHESLQSGPELQARIDVVVPFFRIEEPLIISEAHEPWYEPRHGVRDYYWTTYCEYLREIRRWNADAVMNLDNTTRAILECLANPESITGYSSRGLVMGYVQSGKTANFTGVVARAADAGYRLIIVLAGTWNILRNQTQRRFDKELLGKELLQNDQAYVPHPPDWPEFLEHSGDPVDLGHFAWQRLTRPDYDFRRLKAAIDSLEFERRDRGEPLYAPANLHVLPVKLLVVKKHSTILANLVKDLKLLRTKLTELPTLIIDDESDQAGINTVNPKRKQAGKERSTTNLRIVELVKLFPRGQYVGYTATPYANALINPDDPEDLFPKDFIISLDRPSEYMGVSDFFDPLSDYEDLDHSDYTQAEIAFIRRVDELQGHDDDSLMMALRTYVLAGGIKLFRQAQDETKYKAEYFRHHTMLIHTSPRKGEHATIAERLKQLWDRCALNSPPGLAKLEDLWQRDYAKVCPAQGNDLIPASFDDLIPYLSEAIKRIERGPRVFIVVNSDTAEAPDFSADSVWKIVVGGNKLSRGYTIEGLTVSYYRRVANTADTLMQMGRWFGFRPGYRDLVRVFLGVADGKENKTDLVSQFKEVCRMEERFRDEIKRYLRTPGLERITPKQIPPLISVSGSLLPTATNKMFNALLASKNFGGRWSMFTLTAANAINMKGNADAMASLLASSQSLGRCRLGGVGERIRDGKSETMAPIAETVSFVATNAAIIKFLEQYRWLESDYAYPERPADVGLQIEFLKTQKHGITSWLVIAPQRQSSFGTAIKPSVDVELTVKKRTRNEGRGFQVFGEPGHRVISEFLVGMKSEKAWLASPNDATKALRDPHRGVLLLYPVREMDADEVSIGFEVLFPPNNIAFDLNFTVRRESEQDRVVVTNQDTR